MSHWKRWIVWWAKHRFGIFGKIIPNGLLKIIQRICRVVFHILWELRVRILKNYKDKAKRSFLMFLSMSFICPILNGIFPSQSAPKVLFEPNKDFYSLWNCTNCMKLGENQQRVVCKSKTQTLHVWHNYSKLAVKNYNGVLQYGFLPYSVGISWENSKNSLK